MKYLSVTSRFPRFKSLRDMEMITRMMKIEATNKLKEIEEIMTKILGEQKEKLKNYRE